MQTSSQQTRQIKRPTGPVTLLLIVATMLLTPALVGADEPPPSEVAEAQATRMEGADVLGDRETADSPTEEFPWAGEQFYYSLRVNGVEAMRAVLQTGRLRSSDRGPYVAAGVDVRSVGFFDSLYSVEHHADTYFNPRTLLPYRSEKRLSEKNNTRSYTVDYNHEDYMAQCHYTRRDSDRDYEWRIPGTTHDMISWLYDLRSRSLAMGDSFVFYIYDGWKISEIHIDVVGKEDLYTPAGWFKTWKFKYVRKIVHPMKPASAANSEGESAIEPVMHVRERSRHSGHFWLSRDANHLPLRVTIRSGFGYGEAVLMKYRNPGPETASR